jgi:hypothetical protein
MKQLECSNHSSLLLDPSEKPSESPTATIETVRLSIYQVGLASSRSLAAVEGAKALYTCMIRICYKYEVGGMS